MKINWFKVYISVMVLLAVGIFAYREYRLTVAQNYDIRVKAFNFCYDEDRYASEDIRVKCFDDSKRFLILGK